MRTWSRRQQARPTEGEGTGGGEGGERSTIQGDWGHLMLGERIASQSELIRGIVSGSVYASVPCKCARTSMIIANHHPLKASSSPTVTAAQTVYTLT